MMNRKSKLKINKGEEFKIAIKNINDGDTIFYDQYKQALKMLDDIIETSKKENKDKDRDDEWKMEDYENNIIAFCGERGEGKSSAMFTFINSLNDLDEKILKDAGLENSKVKEVYFKSPIVIDPSQFDGVHNILDIILAKLYEKFSNIYMDEKHDIEEYLKEELLHQFQKVYRQVSMISNQSKMLDDEFDYEGNIGKLSKLGESTRLKKDFRRLLELYLKLKDNSRNKNSKKQQIIIAIDDLDLCSSNAYKMAEQIRKYLILPQVVIVMAVKIEQLELCVQEKNLSDFEKTIKVLGRDNIKIHNEVIGMSERYVSKLIPKARRIYLPKAQSLENTDIIYANRDEDKEKEIWTSDNTEERSLVEKVLKLITEKTGIIFLPEESGISYLLPDNLRDMVNWIVCLVNMEVPKGIDDRRYLGNIYKFYQLFEMGNLDKESSNGWENKVKSIWKMDVIHTHANAKKLLDEIEIPEHTINLNKTRVYGDRKIELFKIMEKFYSLKTKVFDYEDERKIYMLRSLYTIKMNQLKAEGKLFVREGFVNGYIWEKSNQYVMPRVQIENNNWLSRDRFKVKTIDVYNKIMDETSLGFFVDELETCDDGVVKVRSIPEEASKKHNILLWILVGMFCNITIRNVRNNRAETVVYRNNENIIANNRNLVKEVEVSIENYIIGLCSIDEIYNKINMQKLGVTRDEFNEVANVIKDNNKEIIGCMEIIISNIDIGLEIYEYCKKHREPIRPEQERSKEIVDTFFENIYDYFDKKKLPIEVSKENMTRLNLGKEFSIDIAGIYSGLIDCGIAYELGKEKSLIKENYNELMKKFTNVLDGRDSEYMGNKEYKYSSYLKNTTAENTIKNIAKMAGNIVYMESQEVYREYENDIEDLKDNISNLYSKVAEVCARNPYERLKEELIKDYRGLAVDEKRLLNKMKEEI